MTIEICAPTRMWTSLDSDSCMVDVLQNVSLCDTAERTEGRARRFAVVLSPTTTCCTCTPPSTRPSPRSTVSTTHPTQRAQRSNAATRSFRCTPLMCAAKTTSANVLFLQTVVPKETEISACFVDPSPSTLPAMPTIEITSPEQSFKQPNTQLSNLNTKTFFS